MEKNNIWGIKVSKISLEGYLDPFLQKGVGTNPNSPHMVHRASAVGQFNGFTSHLHAWATQLLHSSKASQALWKHVLGFSKSVLTPPMLFDRGDWSVIIGSWQQPKTLPARQQHYGGSYGNRPKIIQSKTYNIYLFLFVSSLKNMMKILISIHQLLG